MSLPDRWLEMKRPARLDLTAVRGRTFQRRWQMQDGADSTTIVATNLTGCTARAVVISDRRAQLLDLGATVSDPANGWIKLKASPAAVQAALLLPGMTPIGERRQRIGGWFLEVLDGTDAITILVGDFYLRDDETPA